MNSNWKVFKEFKPSDDERKEILRLVLWFKILSLGTAL